jgi:hypothetical protein
MAKANARKKPGKRAGKPTRHVELRQLSTDEITRASEQGAHVIIPASCACVVKRSVYGKLIIV